MIMTHESEYHQDIANNDRTNGHEAELSLDHSKLVEVFSQDDQTSYRQKDQIDCLGSTQEYNYNTDC